MRRDVHISMRVPEATAGTIYLFLFPFQFVTFEALTKSAWQYLPSYFSTDFRHVTHFTCGSLAGGVATVTSQPFDVLRTRFVAQGKHKVR